MSWRRLPLVLALALAAGAALVFFYHSNGDGLHLDRLHGADSLAAPAGNIHLKPEPPAYEPIEDNFPLAARANEAADLPPVPAWNEPKRVKYHTPLLIGFTRNWPLLQQTVVSYITSGWPAKDIYVIDNTGTFKSNENGRLSLQNPFYMDYQRLTQVFGVNVMATPTLLSFAQLQNFYLSTALDHGWKQYFWSHMDVLALPDERKDPYRSLYHRAVEVLVETMASGDRWAIRFFAYDRLALVSVKAYEDVGAWDTFIPYHGTKCDMHERLAMANYSMIDVENGFIYDIDSALPDLRVLYREDAPDNTALCAAEAKDQPFGMADCRFDALVALADKMQADKHRRTRGQATDGKTWQAVQRGGQGEPHYRDAAGFEQALLMTNEYGRDIMAEKWGRAGCSLRAAGLGLGDQWRVEKDGDWAPPRSRPHHGCPRLARAAAPPLHA